MMIDTSALVAIILREPGWIVVAARIDAAERPFTTTVAVIEAALALARDGVYAPSAAYSEIALLLERADIRVEPVDDAMIPFALAAREKDGQRILNIGDCISYAAARRHGVELLFVGDDFTKTDVNDEPRHGL